MAQGQSRLASPPGARVGVRPLRVLLVEDDEGDAVLVRELLADAASLDVSGAAPVELTWSRSLREAERAMAVPMDCVLLDLQLPDARDLDGLQRLLKRGSAAVLVLTGQDDERRGVAAVTAGAQDYLVKGKVDGALLARAIRYAVERRRAETVARRLSEAQLYADENRRLARGLLPTPLLLDASLELVTRYQPGGGRMLLGGDFFDAVERPDGSVHVVIGDVCGHGPDEAALGVSLRIAWRTLVLAGLAPAAILETLQQILRHERSRQSMFATLCMVVIRPARDALCLWLAGHPPPLVLDADGARALSAHLLGVPLGVLPDAAWTPLEVSLPCGWALLLYTDGLVEGRIGAGPERLEIEGLIRLVDRAAAGSRWRRAPGAVLDAVIGRVKQLDPLISDDLAALMLVCPQPERTEPEPTRSGPAG